MKAVVFHGDEDIRFEDVPDPAILDPRDALVRVTTASICSSDIHIRHHGRAMRVTPGTILGHEFVGVVVRVGKQVSGFAPDERVAVSCVFSCGECFYCRQGWASQCLQGSCFGAMGDGTNHGAHAELIRVPFASRTMHRIPGALSDEDVLFTGDILSTGFFGAERGGVKEGDTVAVLGGGPVGMCALIASRIMGAAQVIAIEMNARRESVISARGLADRVINPLKEKPSEVIRGMTRGRGADVAIDAAGGGSFSKVFDLVRPGGRVSLVGVYNEAVFFPVYKYWWKNLTVAMGLVETNRMERLIEWIGAGRIDTRFLITSTLPFPEIMKGYEIMEDRNSDVLKVAIKF
jgi:alcohol dehydrogenase